MTTMTDEQAQPDTEAADTQKPNIQSGELPPDVAAALIERLIGGGCSCKTRLEDVTDFLDGLTSEQVAMVRVLVNQGQRTRDMVDGMAYTCLVARGVDPNTGEPKPPEASGDTADASARD